MDLQKGYTFSGISPKNQVTAEKLNTLVDGATILPAFYAGKTENPSASPTDYALILHGASGELRKVQVGNLAPAGLARSGANDLYAVSDEGAQIYVTAAEVLMRAANGRVHLVQNFEALASLGTYAGGPTANGRDSATITLTGVQWWYFWAIGDGVQAKLLYSQSATNPALPAGYLYRALLGAVRLDASGEFVRFVQRNRDVALHLSSAAGTSKSDLNPRTGFPVVEFTNVAPVAARTLQAADLSRCLPPNIVARVRGLIGSTDTGVSYTYAIAPVGYTSLATGTSEILEGVELYPTAAVAAGAGMLGFANVAVFDHLIRDSQQLAWACHTTAAAKHSLRITGYTLSL